MLRQETIDLLAAQLPKDIINYHILPYFAVDLQAKKEVINHLNYLFRPSSLACYLAFTGPDILLRVESSSFSKKYFNRGYMSLLEHYWRDRYQYQSANPLYKKSNSCKQQRKEKSAS
jgi:hypothetical protein